MSHHHHAGCCGGHGEESQPCSADCGQNEPIFLTDGEIEFLQKLSQTPFLPVTQFVMKCSQSDHVATIALTPVFMESVTDSMELVKNRATSLDNLTHYGMIDIDNDVPLENCDYSLFRDSDLFAYFVKTVDDGKAQPNNIFDIAALDCGSIALSGLGQDVIERLEF